MITRCEAGLGRLQVGGDTEVLWGRTLALQQAGTQGCLLAGAMASSPGVYGRGEAVGRAGQAAGVVGVALHLCHHLIRGLGGQVGRVGLACGPTRGWQPIRVQQLLNWWNAEISTVSSEGVGSRADRHSLSLPPHPLNPGPATHPGCL